MRDLPSNLVESGRAKRGWTRKGGGRQNDRLAQQRVEEWGGEGPVGTRSLTRKEAMVRAAASLAVT